MKSSTQPIPLRHHTLANGLRVVLHVDRRTPLVAVNLWYHVGSKNESPNRTGLAHLFEHLLFEGSEHVGKGEHFHHVQQAGGVANGSTWYDRTNYYETLPSHQLDLGLWLESDRLGFFLPGLDQAKLDNQRDVVINERKQRYDNAPYGRASEELFALLFDPGHPYRWPVIGEIPHLEATTLSDVRSFFRTFYRPGNAVLTLAGDFDPDEALAKVERWFGDIEGGDPVARPAVPARRAAGERRAQMEDRVKLPRVYFAMEVPAYGDDAWYAADLLAAAMSAGKASILYQDLVHERQWAQDVAAYTYPTEATGIFVVVATARPGIEAPRLVDRIGQHLDHFGRERLADTDIERAKNQLRTDYYGAWQTVERRADWLSRCATFFDDPAAAFDEPTRYQAVDAAGVRAVATEHLRADRRSILTVAGA